MDTAAGMETGAVRMAAEIAVSKRPRLRIFLKKGGVGNAARCMIFFMTCLFKIGPAIQRDRWLIKGIPSCGMLPLPAP